MPYNGHNMTEQERQFLRAMSPEDKMSVIDELYDFALKLKAAGFRLQHPEWTEQEVQRAIRELLLHART
jgi:hypothetical protein